MTGNKKTQHVIRREVDCREPVVPDRAVARGRMWPICIPLLSFVKKKELSKRVSASARECRDASVCVRALARLAHRSHVVLPRGSKTITAHLVAAVAGCTGRRPSRVEDAAHDFGAQPCRPSRKLRKRKQKAVRSVS